jgi:PPM family protein phosphatase
MMRVDAAGATDTGRVRPANEDAYYVGESVYAVADGMGGHLAGEVASATTLEPVRKLDGKVFPDAADAVKALREAVVAANDQVSQMAADEPSYRGMGTTLTATMLEGARLHVAHVGDSRAYLLRDGAFSQLTDDHTLVQHLVDEGQITQEEAATHPQRSIITRAIGVSTDVDVDSMTLDLESGDQVLLCSDGLTGVVSDDEIAEELSRGEQAEATLRRLIERANDGGGPDNITAVLLRVSGVEAGTAGATRGPGNGNQAVHDTTVTQTAAGQPVVVRTRDEVESEDWARRLGSYGSLGRGSPIGAEEPDEHERSGRGLRLLAIVFGVLLLAGLLVGGGAFLLSQEYFLGLDDEQVVIYQGLDVEIGPVSLARVVERTDLSADDVQPWFRDRLEDGVPAAGLADARSIVQREREDALEDDDANGVADAAGDDEDTGEDS